MSDYTQKNKDTIKRGFAALSASAERVMEEGLNRFLDLALQYLIDAHDMYFTHGTATRHLSENDTLGYAVIHNGKIVNMVAQAGGEWTPRGNVGAKLRTIATDSPKGWVGIVCSDLENDWYRVDWEFDFLLYSKNMTRESFDKCFRRV